MSDLKDFPFTQIDNHLLTPPGTVTQKVVEHADDEPVLFRHLNENLAAMAQVVKPAVETVPYIQYHALVLSLLTERLGITNADVEEHRQKLVAEQAKQRTN